MNVEVKTYSIKRIIIRCLICLLLGHGMLNTYIPNIILNTVVMVIISYYLFFKTINKGDFFSFIMIILICSHFSYGSNQGGLFNLIALTVALLGFQNHREEYKEVNVKDNLISVLLFIFILSNVLGWLLKNPAGLYDKILGILVLVSYLFIFQISRQMFVSSSRLKIFIQVNVALLVWSIVIIFNKFIIKLPIDTPIMGGLSRIGSFNSANMIGSAELSGEYGLLALIFLLPFLYTDITQKIIGLNKRWIYYGIILAIWLQYFLVLNQYSFYWEYI